MRFLKEERSLLRSGKPHNEGAKLKCPGGSWSVRTNVRRHGFKSPDVVRMWQGYPLCLWYCPHIAHQPCNTRRSG